MILAYVWLKLNWEQFSRQLLFNWWLILAFTACSEIKKNDVSEECRAFTLSVTELGSSGYWSFLGERKYVYYIKRFEAIFASHSNKGERDDRACTEPKITKKHFLGPIQWETQKYCDFRKRSVN